MKRTGLFWITLGAEDIAKARKFMDALRGDGTVDVLGLTKAMEAVSDLLFPATSTLHKKIRYQIFVPAIILSMYRSKHHFEPEEELLRLELLLQQTLLKSEKYSVFGANRGEALKYWPSMIYWSSLNALKVWGNYPLGRFEALEIIKHMQKTNKGEEGVDEEDIREIDPAEGFSDLCKKIFPNGGRVSTLPEVTFKLTKEEAHFLRKRFLDIFPRSLTSYILKHHKSKDCINDSGYDLFRFQCQEEPLLSELLRQAENFSRVAMGATYAYRWALCHKLEPSGRVDKDSVKRNATHFERWRKRNKRHVSKWQFQDLTTAIKDISRPFTDPRIAQFIDNYLDKAFRPGHVRSVLEDLDEHMSKWEEAIKGHNRSHFVNPEIQIPRNTLGEGEYSDFLFDYRWRQGSENLRDIFAGAKRT